MAGIGRRVLVVEDEFLAALTTVDALESVGCEVVGPVARLAVALDLAESESLDAAVLDINLAGEMIWPVAERLRHLRVPFVFLSAYSAPEVVPAPFAQVPCLGKPLQPRRLFSQLQAMWDDMSGAFSETTPTPALPR